MSRSTILDDVSPSDLGLPEKFTDFRQVQRELVDYTLYGPNEDGNAQRFTALGCPAGSGKSLGSEALGKVSGKRLVTLTATRSLQDQRREDFEVSDVRGRNNYECQGVTIKDKVTGRDKPVSCEVGSDHYCKFEGALDCPYFAATEDASHAPSVSTNYAWWMASRGLNALALEKSGRIGMLILDEAHLAPEELSRYLSTYLSLDDIFAYSGIAKGSSGVPWRGVAEEYGKVGEEWMQVLVEMQTRCRLARADRLALHEGNLRSARRDERFRHMDDLLKELSKLTRHGADGNWIWQLRNRGVQFDIIWPWRYAERYLFSGVEKVVLMSATLRPKLLSLLGLKRSEVDFKEWPRQFPAVLAPVYSFEGMAKLTWKTGAEDLGKMVAMVDRIIESRPGRKALVHTHSYKRAEYLQAHSKFGRAMILNSSDAGRGGGGLTAMQAVTKYRALDPSVDKPAILVGPSFSTGLDFEGVACEVNIITKIPWPDLSSPIMKARAEDDQYAAYVTMQDLVQACGRGQRTEVDRCETMILDGGIEQFKHFARQHAPQWWQVRKVTEIPKEPVKL